MRYSVRVTGPAGRDLARRLPASVAAAALELVYGALSDNPHRVGKALLPPREGQHSARRGEYRIIYTIDDAAEVVTILSVTHRRDAYRS